MMDHTISERRGADHAAFRADNLKRLVFTELIGLRQQFALNLQKIFFEMQKELERRRFEALAASGLACGQEQVFKAANLSEEVFVSFHGYSQLTVRTLTAPGQLMPD